MQTVPLGIYPTLIHLVFDMYPHRDEARGGPRVIAVVCTAFVSIPVLVASEKSSRDEGNGRR